MAAWYSQSTPSNVMMPPRSVEDIVSAAQDYEYNAQVPIRYWLRTASALLKEAEIYMREGDEETTYLLLFRHAHLILTNLLSHSGAKDASIREQLLQAKREVNKNLKTLDLLKPKINQRCEKHRAILRERTARQAEVQLQHEYDARAPKERRNSSPRPKVHQLHGHKDRELAVSLARREFNRRAGRSSSLHNEPGESAGGEQDLSKHLQAIRTRLEAPGDAEKTSSDATASAHLGYSYPSVRVPDVSRTNTANLTLRGSVAPTTKALLATPPAIPPKPSRADVQVAPPRPDKLHNEPSRTSLHTEPAYTFASSASLENGAPLRTLFLPPTLRTTFLRLAYKNTLANLETCAFLAGTLIANALFVSKLIVPAQIATSDTCEMTNESQLFDHVDSEKDLMVLGWIHTHPTQTCFMSSRDLHTHAGYQMMLPESVAIVCAPSKGDTAHGGDWGVYRLTDPPGKMAILNCTKPGIFHPHDVDNVYTDALRPGHVVEAKGLEFQIVDLRDS